MAKKERVYKKVELPQYERDYAAAVHEAAARAERARNALAAQRLPVEEEDRIDAEITAAERAERIAAKAVYQAAFEAANPGA